MDFTIEFGGRPQDMTITTSGTADVAGFSRMNSALTSDPRFRSGMAILVELSALDCGSKSHRRLFATRDEALAWLREQ
jgi:hypothetical protein